LLNDRQHIALVIDQYGSAVDIVTLEDIIETLLGLEIVDEHDEEVDMQAFARNRWKVRAKKMGLEVPESE
jgi:CBS domain containing-hemolysin-like protein